MKLGIVNCSEQVIYCKVALFGLFVVSLQESRRTKPKSRKVFSSLLFLFFYFSFSEMLIAKFSGMLINPQINVFKTQDICGFGYFVAAYNTKHVFVCPN